MSDQISAVASLSADINKVKGKDGNETAVGVVSEYLPELTLDMQDEDLLKLTEKWEKSWKDSQIRADWIKQVDDNENYWKGKQFNKIEMEQLRPLVDNQIFQSVETFLPAATRQNPEPLVELRSTEPQTEGNIKYAEIMRNRLADWADDTKLRLKIKKAGRHWLLSLVGVGKLGWDLTNDRPSVKIIRPKKLILDKDGITDEDGYSGKFVGEYRKMEAALLVGLIPDKEAEIKALVKDDMGTEVQFIEWWTNEYMCWTLDKKVLLKKKNPHWNYGEDAQAPAQEPIQEDPTAPIEQAPQSDVVSEIPDQANAAPQVPQVEPTAPVAEQQPADPNAIAPAQNMPAIPTQSNAPSIPKVEPKDKNHFPTPRMPYVWLVIFNLGDSPVDVTSLVTQNLPQQDLINKRLKQIDKNVDGMNGGVVVSEEKSGLTKEEAKGVTDALKRGGTVVVPSGSAQDAVYRLPSVALPSDVYNNMLDSRNRMYDLFGVRGITPAGIKNEDTVRGKIITKGLDTDRIGGGITEYLEQFADDIYNWIVQLFYVYDDIFANANAKLPRIKVSVKEGSLLPKDATTKANQAIELANAGKMAIIDLYKALEYPDPEKMAANLWLEANAPEILFKDNPEVMMAIQMKQQQAMQMAQAQAQAMAAKGGGQKGPNESINFKDLPPEGKAQMAKQAGIELGAETLVAHEQQQTENKQKEKTGQGSKPNNSHPAG